MSINWYEQHLEHLVRENQQLKFNSKKKSDIRLLADTITRVFLQLFPDIPPLRVTTNHTHALDQQLAYYQKSATVWIAMTKSKLDLFEENERKGMRQFGLEVQPKTKAKLNKTTIEKIDLCLLCCNPKNQQVYSTFNLKIAKLEKQMNELQSQIKNLQQQEQRYLKQISYLRSITKKLQYQLALHITKQQKSETVKEDSEARQIESMGKEIEIWKAEYDRLWKQLQTMKKSGNKTQSNRFDQQSQLLNSLCRDQIDNGESASTHNSNIWIVRCDDSEWSYQESQQSSEKI